MARESPFAIVLRAGAALSLLVLAGLPAVQARAQPPEKGTLGLCPPNASRLDSYMQALCEGESALQARDFATAQERFRFAAALPRTEATNELAWAGLAAAHCHARELDAGRQWAAHFAQARRLWLGELDCGAASQDPGAQLSPFVRSRMCNERLAADYALVRANPQAAHALDLRARLGHIDAALAEACGAADAMTQAKPKASEQASGAGKRKESAGTPKRRATAKPTRSGAAKKPKSG